MKRVLGEWEGIRERNIGRKIYGAVVLDSTGLTSYL